MSSDPTVVVSAKRTPIGHFGSVFKDTPATILGATSIHAAIEQVHIQSSDIDEVLMGCVLQAGQGQAPARQAALHAGLPISTAAVTVNKMCGSGLKAVMLACDEIQSGSHKVIIAGGMESMSQAPYLLPKQRFGQQMGHGKVYDHMFLDGLEDAYEPGSLMGSYADKIASQYQISREDQDHFALNSLSRARQAIEQGFFDTEITPVTIKQHKETRSITTDEAPSQAKPEKIPQLKPVFSKDGTVTAANASSISDGAAALLLMRQSEAKRRHLTPLATILAHAEYANAPGLFPIAPIGAIKKLLAQLNNQVNDIDLYEINEAFALVTLVTMEQLNIPLEKVNVCGGACALGHPIGASGARILTTLIYALKRLNQRRGVASLCIGGGEAVAMAIEV